MSVTIERKGNRIVLRSPFPTPGLSACVPGANFSRVGGAHWSIPLTLAACHALRKRFGRELRVGTDLAAWAREEIERSKRMTALGRAQDAELLRVPEVAPPLASAMASRTYQRVAARFIAEGWSQGGILNGDHAGLGKTLETIGGIIESGTPGPYLVVCPKTAIKAVWEPEILRWWPGASVIALPEGRAKREEILNAFVNQYHNPEFDNEGRPFDGLEQTFVVINPEVARTKSWWVCNACGHKMKWKAGPKQFECEHGFDPKNKGHREDEHEYPQIFQIQWGAIVADESDMILLRLTGTPTQVRAGAELLPLRSDGARLPASGTPFRSRPQLLWGTLNWMYPQVYTSFWRWVETYYEVTRGYGTSRTIGKLREGMEQQLDAELSGIMIRRTKEEVAQDMPPKTFVGTTLDPGDPRSPVAVWLDMDPAQQKLYDQMRESSVATLEGGDLNAIGVLAEMTRLKQFASSAGRLVEARDGYSFRPTMPSNKLEYIWEYLANLGYPDDPETKVVIASQFNELLDLAMAELRSRLGRKFGDRFGISAVTGRVTGQARADTVQRFNLPVGSRSEHIIALNTKAGGRMLTIDTADHTFILDRTWIDDDQSQLEDRTHRVSRPRPVFYHYLHSRNSIDESIAIVNEEQRQQSHQILDGRRGIEYTRRILEVLK